MSVAFAGVTEVRAGGDDHAVAEQPLGARLRGLVPGNLDPEVHRRFAGCDTPALPVEYAEQDVALTAVRLTGPRDVRLVIAAYAESNQRFRDLLAAEADTPAWRDWFALALGDEPTTPTPAPTPEESV